MTERHPDHERVKVRLMGAVSSVVLSPDVQDALVRDAIALGARAPDPIEELVKGIMPMLRDWKLQRTNWTSLTTRRRGRQLHP